MTKDNASVRKVVGLKYEIGEGLPQVILKGSGKLADEIIERRDIISGPQVVKDKALVNELFKLPVDAEIGPELFELVAILLVHVYAIEEKMQQEQV